MRGWALRSTIMLQLLTTLGLLVLGERVVISFLHYRIVTPVTVPRWMVGWPRQSMCWSSLAERPAGTALNGAGSAMLFGCCWVSWETGCCLEENVISAVYIGCQADRSDNHIAVLLFLWGRQYQLVCSWVDLWRAEATCVYYWLDVQQLLLLHRWAVGPRLWSADVSCRRLDWINKHCRQTLTDKVSCSSSYRACVSKRRAINRADQAIKVIGYRFRAVTRKIIEMGTCMAW